MTLRLLTLREVLRSYMPEVTPFDALPWTALGLWEVSP